MKLRVIFLTVLTVLLLSLTANAESLGDIYYKITDGTASITGCNTHVTEVTIPYEIDGAVVTKIAKNAFYNCSALGSITIPQGVTTIESNAFYGCTALDKVYISDIAAWCNISFGTTNANPLKPARYMYLNGMLVSHLTIPDGVTAINNYVFNGYENLASVTLPASVTTIGIDAFNGCSKMMSVKLPEGLTSIASNAFYGCSSLTSVTLPDSLKTLGTWAFYKCSLLKDVTIGKGLTSIASYAFNGTAIEAINIPTNITKIDSSAFTNCKSLTDVIIPDSVTSIGTSAFANCTKLVEIELPDSLSSISDSMFSSCSLLEKVILPEGVTKLGVNAFNKCTALKTIDLPDSITAIGNNAFYGCTALERIVLPAGITAISNFTFQGCTALRNLVIPSSVTSIGTKAFYGCTSLLCMYIPESVTIIDSTAFTNCTALKVLGQPDSKISSFATVNSITFVDASVFSYEGSCGTKATFTFDLISGKLTISGTGAIKNFSGSSPAPWKQYASMINEVEIGNGITAIGNQAFALCNALTQLTVPEGVTTIGTYAFSKCTALKDITLPESLTSIGSNAFSGCSGYTFYVKLNSYAHKYAIDNSIPVELVSNVHSHSYSSVVTAPTCTEGGYTTYTCAGCGDSYTADETPATGHTMGDWITDNEPQPGVEGSRHRDCTSCGYTESETIEALPEETKAEAIFTISDAKARPGETVKLTLSIKSEEVINSIALSNFVYDSDILEFVGFSDTEAIEELCVFAPLFDAERGFILIALARDTALDMDICTLEFKVKEGIGDCTATVSASSVVKLNYVEYSSSVEECSITVQNYLIGDIDGDEDVDIDDAVYLFGYTMLPEHFPLSYPGDIEFTGDGVTDVRDAVALFRYSMLPDVYPLN